MDFTKFASLLDTNALFFSQADQLSDAWEGAYTAENLHRPVIWGDSNGGEAVVMDTLTIGNKREAVFAVDIPGRQQLWLNFESFRIRLKSVRIFTDSFVRGRDFDISMREVG